MHAVSALLINYFDISFQLKHLWCANEKQTTTHTCQVVSAMG